MQFKRWLTETGTNAGIGGGLAPSPEIPTDQQGAFADYHGEDGKDPKNPNGKLPPVAAKAKKKIIRLGTI